MQNNLVSIIIVNFKQKVFLKDCLSSLYGNIKSYPFEVIVINNSPEENLDNLKQDFSDLLIIENENSGFSKSNNLGSKYANGKYFLFLNPDTTVKNDFFSDALKLFDDYNCAVVGLALQNENETFQVSFGYEITFLNEFKNKKLEKISRKQNPEIEKIKKDYSNTKEVDWVSGAAILIRNDVFNDINGFDERFFLYYEDADICKRIKDKGYKIFYYPASLIIHLKGENIDKSFLENTYYFAKKSQILYYEIHNNSLQKVLIRIYLFLKFYILAIITWKKIYFRILRLIISPNNKGLS